MRTTLIWFCVMTGGLLYLSGCQESGHTGQNTTGWDRNQHLVYCSNCGVIAGESTKCPVDHDGEHYLKKNRPPSIVVCRNCGAMPSRKGTKCSVDDGGEHFFRDFQVEDTQ